MKDSNKNIKEVDGFSDIQNKLDERFQWVEIKELPSNNKVYKVDAYIRPYSYGDMIQINKSTLDKFSRVYQYAKGLSIFNRQTGEVFNPSDLTISDFFYLSYLRNLITTGGSKVFTSTWVCPHCKEENDQEIDVSNIEFEDLEDDFPLVEDISGEPWNFHVVTIGEYVKVKPTTKERILAMSCDKEEEDILDCIDYLGLMAMDEAMNHSAKPLEVVCDHCDMKVNMSFEVEDEDGTSSLVHPFRQS